MKRGRAPGNKEREPHGGNYVYIQNTAPRDRRALAAGIIALSACGSYVPHEPGTDNPGGTPGIEQPDDTQGEDTEDLTT